MSSDSPLLLFLWSSLFLAGIELPDVSRRVGPATVYDPQCTSVRVGATNGTLNSSLWSLRTTEASVISCSVGVKMGLVNSRIFFVARVDPGVISFQRPPNDDDGPAASSTDRCDVNVTVEHMWVQPPNRFIDFLAKRMTRFLVSGVRSFVCDEALPRLKQELRNHTVNRPLPPPELVRGATPLSDALFFRAVLNVVNNLTDVRGAHCSASPLAETTIRLRLYFPHGFNVTWGNTTPFSLFSLFSLFSDGELADSDAALHAPFQGDVLSETPAFLFEIDGGAMEAMAPYPFEASVDVSFNGLVCDAAGMSCTLPCTDGVTLQNVRLKGLREWDRIVVNYAGPFASRHLNKFLGSHTEALCNTTSKRFLLPMSEVSPVVIAPPVVVLALFLLAAVVVLAAVVILGIQRHRQAPLKMWDGCFMSLRRVLVEDIAFVLLLELTALLFMWSNMTTAAVVVLGGETGLLSFSLVETTRSLYTAGVKVLAVLVLFFSGMYPYIKLVCIFLCTLVLQKPESRLLRVIDFLGRYSFIDPFAMIVMSRGLLMDGVVTLKIYPGFYMFLAATVLSIISGNYATIVWRRNTSLRGPKRLQDESAECVVNEPLLSSLYQADVNVNTTETPETSQRNCEQLVWFVLRIILAAGFILPVWVLPCLRYHVGGVSGVLQPDDRNMSLFELSSLSTPLFFTCVLTMGVFPFLHIVTSPRWPVLATWSATDPFLLACVAGLWQLEDFIEYMLGKNVRAVYKANVFFNWPLIPLLFVCVWQWALSAEDVFGLSERVRRYLERCKERAELLRGITEAEDGE